MHRSLAAVGVTCLMVAITCTACAREDITDNAAAAPASTPAAGAEQAVAAVPSPVRQGAGYLGDSSALDLPVPDRPPMSRAPDRSGAPQSAAQLTVTPDAVVTDARPASGGGRRPADGEHWDAVRVDVTNTGWDTYEGPIGDAFTLLDSGGRGHRPVPGVAGLTVGEPLDPRGRLLLGERADGWVTFSLPADATASELRFRHPGGAPDDDARWHL
ncbi:hypothetical protein ACFVT5_17200 [Streptomyces sp. NPDC058001]|uniref:hypothetical protein n=1 Tax=Streptomyces sp. NPDC058001 TaxID=3346300 RepID=UPI0036EAB166